MPLNIVCGNCAQYQHIFHYAILSGDIFNAQHHKWQKTLDVDLTAVMVGTRLAVQCMQAKKNPGEHCSFQNLSSCHCAIEVENYQLCHITASFSHGSIYWCQNSHVSLQA